MTKKFTINCQLIVNLLVTVQNKKNLQVTSIHRMYL